MIDNFLGEISEINEFYKNVIKEHNIMEPKDIERYPILTRQHIQDNRYKMFSKGYKSKFFSQQLRRQSSSGTSGVPVNVYWDYKDYNASMLSLWRLRMKYYDILPYDKVMKFTLPNAEDKSFKDESLKYYMESNSIMNISRLSLNSQEKYEKLIHLMHKFSPKWLYIQPSVLEKVIISLRKLEVKPPKSITYIESVGELLDLSLKEEAERVFGVPVVNMYGSEEMNGIAYECPFHKMHIIESNVYVEINNGKSIEEYGEGEAIITNLKNKAMPLIRYNQGDRININKGRTICPCGITSKEIQIIYGRSQNSIKIKEIEINSLLLTNIISEVNKIFFDMILEFRFEYFISKKLMECFISIDDDKQLWFEQIRDKIEKEFYTRIPLENEIEINVIMERHNYLYGKRRIFEIQGEREYE